MKLKKSINIVFIFVIGLFLSFDTMNCSRNIKLNGFVKHKIGNSIEAGYYTNGVKNGWYARILGAGDTRYQYYYINGTKHGWSFQEGREGENIFFRKKVLYWHGREFGTRNVNRGWGGGQLENRQEIPTKLPYDIDVSSAEYMPQEWPSPFFGYTGDDYYHPDNLLDQIKETVWVSKHTDFESYKLESQKFNNQFAKYCVIVNGNRINSEEYYKFSRVKEAEIEIYRKGNTGYAFFKKIKIKFNDNFEIKRIPIFDNHRLTVDLKIKSIYPGTQYKNVAISDMYLEF